MTDLTLQAIRPVIRRALKEDAAFWDITSRSVVPRHLMIRARVIAKARGIAAGVSVAGLTFRAVDSRVNWKQRVRSGAAVTPGAVILTVEGRAWSIFSAERVALNFLGHLSGIATLTAEFVRRVKGTRAKILDTRKTLPGLRALQKYAVAAGGGVNHRATLQEAVLIKTNHLKAMRLAAAAPRAQSPIQVALQLARRQHPGQFIQVEVTNLRELAAALAGKPDAVLLDNWAVPAIAKAVKLRGRNSRTPLLEVSGSVTLDNVAAIAKTGVDRISIGRLTHSAPSLDVSLSIDAS